MTVATKKSVVASSLEKAATKAVDACDLLLIHIRPPAHACDFIKVIIP